MSKGNIYDSITVDYPGMLFNFSVTGQVSISMENMMVEFATEVEVGDDARAELLAANYLFNIAELSNLID